MRKIINKFTEVGARVYLDEVTRDGRKFSQKMSKAAYTVLSGVAYGADAFKNELLVEGRSDAEQLIRIFEILDNPNTTSAHKEHHIRNSMMKHKIGLYGVYKLEQANKSFDRINNIRALEAANEELKERIAHNDVAIREYKKGVK